MNGCRCTCNYCSKNWCVDYNCTIVLPPVIANFFLIYGYKRPGQIELDEQSKETITKNVWLVRYNKDDMLYIQQVKDPFFFAPDYDLPTHGQRVIVGFSSLTQLINALRMCRIPENRIKLGVESDFLI